MYQIDELKYCIGDEVFHINEHISIRNPSVREVREFGEDLFYFLIQQITQKPYDIAVELWDSGEDYADLTCWDLFRKRIIHIPKDITSILFGDLDFTKFVQVVDNDNGLPCLLYRDNENAFILDEVIYKHILQYIQYMYYIPEKVEYDMGNKSGRKFLIERMRRKQNKRKKDIAEGKIRIQSNIFSMIRYCVNHQGFKYDYSSVMDLRLSLLYESYYQLQHEDDRQNVLFSIYNGKLKYSDVKDKESISVTADLRK